MKPLVITLHWETMKSEDSHVRLNYNGFVNGYIQIFEPTLFIKNKVVASSPFSNRKINNNASLFILNTLTVTE